MQPTESTKDVPVTITVLARWTGFARPSQKCNRLVIQRSSTSEYTSFDAMNLKSCSVESQLVHPFLDAIRLDCPSAEPLLFGRSQDELEHHFGGCSTDDYPAMKMRIEFAEDRTIEMSTNSNHAHLLPWTISDPDERTSFNPQISVRLAKLMPEGFLFRDRLLDSSADFDLDRLLRGEIARIDDEKVLEPSEESFELRQQRVHEQLKRFADVARHGESVNFDGPKVHYTANQLRRLSEQQLSELASQGFDLSTSDETGQTALMLAAFPPFNIEQFRKLVRIGADVNARRSDGLTGLMLACAGSEELSVREWLHAGASVDLRGPHRCTALMLGAKNGVIVSDLLSHGARATDLDDDGDTALDYAMEDISIMWAGKRLKSIELLSSVLAVAAPDSLVRSHQRSLDIARRLKLEIEIEREFGGRPMSEAIRDTKAKQSHSAYQTNFLNDALEFIDLEISEVELADRIVEILGAPVCRQPKT